MFLVYTQRYNKAIDKLRRGAFPAGPDRPRHKEDIAVEENAKYRQFQEAVLRVVSDTHLTHEQAMMQLSRLAESYTEGFPMPEGFLELQDELDEMSAMGEGFVPYVPRYILPDYDKLMREGCQFLRLDPPTNLREAINTLEIFYHHVPSTTHFPVFIGKLDRLLDPFIEDEAEAKVLIKDFMRFIDRTISDSFCHGDLGPEATTAGRLILEAERELQDSTPNITLLYDPDKTPDDFACLCVQAALDCAKPSFANHKMFSADLGENEYGIASCYNGLLLGGGSYTLARLLLNNIAFHSEGKEDFFQNRLPRAIDVQCAIMDAKIDFLVNKSAFFRSNFLVTEGFVHPDRFTGMFGMVGMCECVNDLLKKEGVDGRYGHDEVANALGDEIMAFIDQRVKAHHNPYCPQTGGRFLLHAQVGVDSDSQCSPGVRIAIGDEPELYDHLRHCGRYEKYFVSGAGDIFPFESTAARNPESVLDVIKGGFAAGMRYFSTYSSDSDVIRITGYLVKRSDMEKYDSGKAVQHDTVALGANSMRLRHFDDRKLRSLC